jgi:glycosyltransferase involved in cell wall biosynthesis
MLVSIIIPVYGSVNLLKDSLKSAINQTYNNCEILIVDDGSKQKEKITNIIKIVSKSNKKKIRLISYKKNRGVAYALNKGIINAKGQIISWLSHDDIFLKTKIEKQISKFKDKNINIVTSNFIEWNVKKNKFVNRALDTDYFKEITKSLLLNDKLHGCSMLFRKKCFNTVGLFDTNLYHTQDYDMWIRMSEKFKFYHYDEYLLISRNHSNQNSKLRKAESLKEKDKLYIKYSKKIKFSFIQKNISLFKKKIINLL